MVIHLRPADSILLAMSTLPTVTLDEPARNPLVAHQRIHGPSTSRERGARARMATATPDNQVAVMCVGMDAGTTHQVAPAPRADCERGRWASSRRLCCRVLGADQDTSLRTGGTRVDLPAWARFGSDTHVLRCRNSTRRVECPATSTTSTSTNSCKSAVTVTSRAHNVMSVPVAFVLAASGCQQPEQRPIISNRSRRPASRDLTSK
jgi:hypothetical protein